MSLRDPLRRLLAPADPLLRLLQPAAGLTRFAQDLEISSLWRWARLSVLVGVAVGLVAAGFYWALEWSETTLLYGLAGHEQPAYGPVQHALPRTELSRWWLLLLLPAAGGLVAGLVVHFFARGEGQGSEALVDAYHNQRGRISLRDAVVRGVASTFTLGTGGSAGREGPIAFLGGGFGAWIGDRLHLSARDRRLLLLAGAAGGISALFRTPLGAALWALEVLYRDDFESDGMFPSLVSSVTAYSIFTSIHGEGSLFAVPAGGYDFAPAQLVFYGLMAVGVAPFAVLWIRLITRDAPAAFGGFSMPAWLKPAIGGLVLGSLALALPWVLGAGYGWVQDALLAPGDPTRRLPVGLHGFGLLLGIACAKMLATALTVSSGGSGGLFAPSLFIGGFVGGAFGLLFHEVAPGVVTDPGAFVLVGMGAFYAGAAHVPISTIILVSELFGSYDLLVPLMLVVMISMLLLRRFTLLPAQVDSAFDSPAHAERITVDVLRGIPVSQHYTPGRGTEPVRVDMHLSDFLEHISRTAESFFVVSGEGGRLVGSVSLEAVRAVIGEDDALEFILVGDAMTPLASVGPSASLADALETIVKSGHEYVPVIDPESPHEVLGLISQRQIAAEYNAEILRRRMAQSRTGVSEALEERR